MIRVVLDTNVIVSGLLSPSGPPGRVIDLVNQRLIHIVYCDEILIEYADVLRRRQLGISLQLVDAFLEEVKSRGTNVAVGPWPLPVPDESDSMFLAAAIAGDAMVITGNLRHYPNQVRLGIDVVSPRMFVDRYAVNVVPLPGRSEDSR